MSWPAFPDDLRSVSGRFLTTRSAACRKVRPLLTIGGTQQTLNVKGGVNACFEDKARKDTRRAFVSIVEGLRGTRKGPLWYRGCGKVSHELKPSLYRHKGSKTIEDFMALEKRLLSRFRERSIPFHAVLMTDPWEWLFLMQHYGVPTRLLDWSESPLMALFFAVTSARYSLGSRRPPGVQRRCSSLHAGT